MFINTSFRDVAYFLIIIIGSVFILYIGSSIILPFIFALIFATFLYPINKKIQTFIKVDWISITLSFLSVLIPLVLILMIFAFQLMEIVDSFASIGDSLKQGAEKVVDWIRNIFPFFKLNPNNFIKTIIGSSIDGPLNVVSQGLMSSTTILASIFLTFIYTFLLLLYRKSIKNFIIFQFEKQFRSDLRKTISIIKATIQSYIGGLFIIIAFLSIVNSIGLAIIGVDYPIFWGTMAGFLAIIPYIGTGIGSLLPFLYSLSMSDNYWEPVAIVLFFAVVQALEGNLITPKIVGDKVNINPLFAILSLMFFGSLWGIGGIVLALPIISILRIILAQFDATLPLAVLMSSDLSDKSHKFAKIDAE